MNDLATRGYEPKFGDVVAKMYPQISSHIAEKSKKFYSGAKVVAKFVLCPLAGASLYQRWPYGDKSFATALSQATGLTFLAIISNSFYSSGGDHIDPHKFLKYGAVYLATNIVSLGYETVRAARKKFRETRKELMDQKSVVDSAVDLESRCLVENFDRLSAEHPDTSDLERAYVAWYDEHMAVTADPKFVAALEPVEKASEQTRAELRARYAEQNQRGQKLDLIHEILQKRQFT